MRDQTLIPVDKVSKSPPLGSMSSQGSSRWDAGLVSAEHLCLNGGGAYQRSSQTTHAAASQCSLGLGRVPGAQELGFSHTSPSPSLLPRSLHQSVSHATPLPPPPLPSLSLSFFLSFPLVFSLLPSHPSRYRRCVRRSPIGSMGKTTPILFQHI